MVYACFLTTAEAERHRANFGGWLFTTTTGQIFWFDPCYTASKVLTHRALAGYEGALS